MLTTVYNIVSLVEGVFKGTESEDTHKPRWTPGGHEDSLAAVWQKENRMMSYVVLMAWELNVRDRKPDTSLVQRIHW